ncbi:hypothetical protein GC170_00735 [bacterium]|nr:hypothetical protein [bacterium]
MERRGSYLIIVLMAALAFAPGCRTLNLNSPNRLDRPGADQRRLSPAATQIVEKWSDNAAKVRTLKAQPTVKLTSVDGRRRFSGGVSGRMAMERPRNFKLDLSTNFGQVADIGSNDEMIWFWVKDGTEGVYLARYTEDGQPSAPLNIDPQWVMEAMGLQVMTPEQIAKLDIRRDPATRHMVFSERRDGPAGERWIKETEMDAAGDVVAHRLFEDHTPRKLLASAEIEGWQTIALPREAGSAVPPPGSNDDSAAAEIVLLPEKIKLFWALDQLTIEVRLHNPQVNQPFNDEFRLAQFQPQEKRGQKFIDISDPRLLASKRSRPSATAGSGNAPSDNLAKVSDPPPLARLKEPEPLKAPEIPSVLPGDPTPEGVAPRRVGPVNPSLNVAPSSASTARGDATPISRRSLPRPR